MTLTATVVWLVAGSEIVDDPGEKASVGKFGTKTEKEPAGEGGCSFIGVARLA